MQEQELLHRVYFSPDSSIRTTAIIVGIIMIGIGWYKKSKNDKKIFQYMKEQNNFEKKLLNLVVCTGF